MIHRRHFISAIGALGLTGMIFFAISPGIDVEIDMDVGSVRMLEAGVVQEKSVCLWLSIRG